MTSCVQLDIASIFLARCGLNGGLIVLSITQPPQNDSFHCQSLNTAFNVMITLLHSDLVLPPTEVLAVKPMSRFVTLLLASVLS